jgi:hypothetical protein
MDRKHLLVLGASILAASLGSPGGAQEPRSPYVRVAEIEINPGQLEPYRAAAKEQIEAAVGSSVLISSSLSASFHPEWFPALPSSHHAQ